MNFQAPGFVSQRYQGKATRALATPITVQPGVPMPGVDATLASTP